MNAPADELRKILAVMAHEKALVGKTGGKMTGPDAATLNSEYEAATSGSDRAEHHDHSSFSDHDDHGHDDLDADEEHEDEEHVHGGEKPRRMTKYGPMVGDESVEDAGEPSFGPDGKPVQAGQLPSATGSFLDLADENSSHFSPENIRLNFKPKHLLALDLAREAWEARNPGKKAPAVPDRRRQRRREEAGRGRGSGRRAERAHAQHAHAGGREGDGRRPGQAGRGPEARHAGARGRELQGRRRPAGGAGADDVRLRRALPHGRVRRRARGERRVRPQVGAGVVREPARGGAGGARAPLRGRGQLGRHGQGQGGRDALRHRGRGRRAGHHAQARPRQVQRARREGQERQGHGVGDQGRRAPLRLARDQGAGRGGDQDRARRGAGDGQDRRDQEPVRGARLRPGRGDDAREQELAPDRGSGHGPDGVRRGVEGDDDHARRRLLHAREGLHRQASRPARLQGQAGGAQGARERQAQGAQVPEEDRGVRRQAQAARL